ncbi:MAG: tryptophan--tRNA ligase [Desulfobacterales bacterium]|nr:tryptophan--tRNA ligase [Desulfobacterales bacterium]
MASSQHNPIVLTGIKPTGQPHLGNYLGSIRPALELAERHPAYYFVADGHALTTVRDPARLARHSDEVAATWLALGLDPERVVFYRRSAVPEIFELMWILACTTAKGLLNRAHAYKAAVALNQAADRDDDADVQVGLYTYPLLMAADILAMDADLVPVGRDQQQHVEMARDMAMAFNRAFGQVLKPPVALIQEEVPTLPGVDGRKMSKSYNNEIPLFGSSAEIRRRVMRIVTDSRRPEEPKDPEACHIFALYRQVAPSAAVAGMRQRYLQGGLAYREAKEALIAALEGGFGTARARFAALLDDRAQLAAVLARGTAAARRQAGQTLARMRRAVGLEHGGLQIPSRMAESALSGRRAPATTAAARHRHGL